MKNKKKITLGSLFVVSMMFSLWVQFEWKQNDQMSADLMRLNMKHGVMEVETLGGDEKMNPFLMSLFQTNIMAEKMDGKEMSKVILKMKGDGGLEDVMALSLQTEDDLEMVAEDFARVEGVEWAEPDWEIELTGWEDEVGDLMRASHEIEEMGGKKVLVGLVDSGVDLEHPLLEGRVRNDGWDFVENVEKMDDVIGHGTHVAGIILANSRVAEILPVKFTDGKTGSLVTLLKGMKFAVDKGVAVLNLSLGVDKDSPALKEGVKYAEERGVIVVAAAGNDGKDMKYFPAAWEGVVGVAALTKDGERFEMSNFGEWVDFSAVGKDVLSAHPGGMWALRSGTSQAAPLVAAAVCEVMVALEDGEVDLTLENVMKVMKEVSVESEDGKLGRVVKSGNEVEVRLEAMESLEEEKEEMLVLRSEVVAEGRSGRVRFRSLW